MKQLLIYLLTTSDRKAAHLRALFNKHGLDLLRWKAFRGYPELQAERASDSLKVGAGYIRARFTRPFLIEDTEVRIEAYCEGARVSYPGFDLKRWWKVTTFEELDAKCIKAGTRSATQTCNLCLSIPGLDPFVFRGTVRGEIAREPYRGLERPEAPWLGPGEFGTVFVPQGAQLPFAALPLEESLRFDFRRRAVVQAVAKIAEIHTALNLDRSCYALDDEIVFDNSEQFNLFELDRHRE